MIFKRKIKKPAQKPENLSRREIKKAIKAVKKDKHMRQIVKIKEELNPICEYCGHPMQTKFDEYYPFHECDCEDAQKEREIEAKIRELELQLPKKKYEVIDKPVIVKID